MYIVALLLRYLADHHHQLLEALGLVLKFTTFIKYDLVLVYLN